MEEKTKETNLIKVELTNLMGKVLDLARISAMSDRSFNQFQKSIKDEFYKSIEKITNDTQEIKA